jgi:hypothetical protein
MKRGKGAIEGEGDVGGVGKVDAVDVHRGSCSTMGRYIIRFRFFAVFDSDDPP